MDISDNDKLQVARVMVDHATSIAVHSGNILNWNTLKKGINVKSSDELNDALESTIAAWMNSIGNDLMNIQEPLHMLEIMNSELMRKFQTEQRPKFKITAKVFLSHWRSTVIKESVSKACASLGVSKLDALIVTFPVAKFGEFEHSDSTIQTNADLQRIKPIWKEIEALVNTGLVDAVGVTDFDRHSLEQLHSWASVKPSINQICMANCCDLPSDLLEFSHQHDVELLSHNDPPEMMSEKSMRSLLDSTGADSHNWTPSYVLRYSAVVKCRGIVEAKGYIVGAETLTEDGIEEVGFF